MLVAARRRAAATTAGALRRGVNRSSAATTGGAAAAAAAAANAAAVAAAAFGVSGVRGMASASPRMGWPRHPAKAKAVRLSKLKPRDVRYLIRTLPAPLQGTAQRVRHLREPAVECWVHSLSGERVGMTALDRDVFAHPIRVDIVNDVVRWQLAARRQGTAKGKNRTEVAGSNKKIRAQKGSGLARQGDGKAPHFVGGGSVFPPQPRSYFYALPKDLRRKGVKSALSAKYAEGNLFVIDSVESASHRTKDIIANALGKWPQFQAGKSFLVLHEDAEMDPNFALATRNLPNVSILPVTQTNTYDLLQHEVLLVTQRALPGLTERLTKIPSDRNERLTFAGPALYLQPQVGVSATATANRMDFLDTLTPRERKAQGDELIKVGENKRLKFVPMSDAERAQWLVDAEAKQALPGATPWPTYRQVVPGSTPGAVRLATVTHKPRAPLTRVEVVDGSRQRTHNWAVYRKFARWQAARDERLLSDSDAASGATKQAMLSRSTLQPPKALANAAAGRSTAAASS